MKKDAVWQKIGHVKKNGKAERLRDSGVISWQRRCFCRSRGVFRFELTLRSSTNKLQNDNT